MYRREERLEIERKGRMTLAAKIVLAVSNKIEGELIRPGPVAEERECYEMAQELKDMTPELQKLVEAILKIEAEEGK